MVTQNCGVKGCTNAATIAIKIPETFRNYDALTSNIFCSRCASLFTNPDARRYNWYQPDPEKPIIKISNIDVIPFLQNMPAPPYTLYFTKKHRKHGWRYAIKNPVHNTSSFQITCDEEQFLFERQQFETYINLLNALWARETPKNILLGGFPEFWAQKKYRITETESLQLEKIQHNPLWIFLVHYKRKPKEE
ncbi:MAG: hypothetical protein FWD52_08010 [Candidatus Bathyarchaeota archaeon]|nr:hypothetical protein [Candidatus Termiticorpusculum sp.]